MIENRVNKDGFLESRSEWVSEWQLRFCTAERPERPTRFCNKPAINLGDDGRPKCSDHLLSQNK